MTRKDKFLFAGGPIFIVALIAMVALAASVHYLSGELGRIGPHIGIGWILGVPLLASAVVLAKNAYAYQFQGKRTFGLEDSLSTETGEKRRAMHPRIPTQYLADEPEGLVLGRSSKKYVRIDTNPNSSSFPGILHTLILGGSGSGKTSGPLLSTLIPAMSMGYGTHPNFFVIDIKPEIAKKSIVLDAPGDVRIVNPVDRTAWGWNVYYNISTEDSDDTIIRHLDTICQSLIPPPSEEKNAFFYNSARDILKAALLYYFRCERGFIDSLNAIMSASIADTIQSILTDSIHCPKGGKIYMLLKRFDGKDSDAMQDIELTLFEKMSIFSLDTIRFFLRDNPNKVSPRDLANGMTSIFLVLEENHLDELTDLLRLITTQIIKSFETRSEDSPVTMLILDELPRLGRIPHLENMLATVRSRMCSIVMAVQDLSQLETVYGRDVARTIINLCEVTCILSCRDNASAKTICEWAGSFREPKSTYSRKGLLSIPEGKESVSHNDRKVLEPSDLMSLQDRGEEALFIRGKLYCPRKIYYFKDRKITPVAEQIKNHNARR